MTIDRKCATCRHWDSAAVPLARTGYCVYFDRRKTVPFWLLSRTTFGFDGRRCKAWSGRTAGQE